MDLVLVYSTLVKLGFALFALAIIQLFTILNNKGLNENFKANIYSIIDDTPLSLAIYHGIKWLGACILLGMVLA